MRCEPSKQCVANAIMSLIVLETYAIEGWRIPEDVKAMITQLKLELTFQYQFLK